jgi:hypothetical protein
LVVYGFLGSTLTLVTLTCGLVALAFKFSRPIDISLEDLLDMWVRTHTRFRYATDVDHIVFIGVSGISNRSVDMHLVKMLPTLILTDLERSWRMPTGHVQEGRVLIEKVSID